VELDHGAFVPLWYAAAEARPAVVLMAFGMAPRRELYEAGRRLRAVCSAAETGPQSIGVIASGDLSHRLVRGGPYPYSPRGAEFDAIIVDILRRGAFDEFLDVDEALVEEAGQCGLRSFIILAGFLSGGPAGAEVLSYEGPFGVGYCVARQQARRIAN